MKLLIIAWRNLWRNKRRTLITVSSVFFGVVLCSLMGSLQEGSYNSLIKNVVDFYAGYMQVQHEEYWDDPNINHSFEQNIELLQQIESETQITYVVPRLESFTLVSSGEKTKGAMVMGIDPEKETQLTTMADKITDGNYLLQDDKGILIGYELAARLSVQPGDTLVLFGQGYHGVTAAGKYPIRGLFKLSNPVLNRQLVYLEINAARELFMADKRLTALVLMVKDNHTMKKILPALKRKITSPYRVMSWEEMFPTLIQQIESDRSSAFVMKGILYLVIMFGIFGTVMMMISERKREFGVMMSIGMQKYTLAFMVFSETLFMGMLGVCLGFIGSMPVVGYFFFHPIPIGGNAAEWMNNLGFEPFMYFAWDAKVFINQVIVVFMITVFVSIFPFIRILRLTEMKALKG